MRVFSFVRALAGKVMRNKRKMREELDIWRLYHFLSYRKQVSEGTDYSNLKFPNQNASYRKQYGIVHSAVTQQVLINLPVSSTSAHCAIFHACS